MATIETRAGWSNPARASSRLARRLPWAVAVLALAAGYGIGHRAAPDAAAPTGVASVVTPEQVNQALAASSGHAEPVNDRGYSQLENGVQHGHGFDLPMTVAERQELGRQLDLARQAALQYPTLGDAKRAGMFRAGPFSPGLGTHMIMPSSFGYSAGAEPMTDDQIRHPLAWIYDGTSPEAPVIGLFYQARVEDPAGFVGPNDVWHKHSNICTTVNPEGGFDAPLGADRDVTKEQCDAVGGTLIRTTSPLLHAWVVPGYEDSEGVFAHLNPAVTCDDGTYHTVDLTRVGTRTTACADGSK